MNRKERMSHGLKVRELKVRKKKNQSLVRTLLLVGLILGQFTAGHLITPEKLYSAEPSAESFIEVSLSVSESHSWKNKGQLVSSPVMVGNRLYLYTFIQGQQFQLWRGDPNYPDVDSNDPDMVWKTVSLGGGGLNDLEATALGSHKEQLYVATRVNTPYIWWREDPNQGNWKSVTPLGISSGKITALSSFKDHLYMGVTDENSGGVVQLWQSTKVLSSQEPSSNNWKQIGGNYTARISCGFQEFEGKLYLGVENAKDRAEIWSLDGSDASPSDNPSKYLNVGSDVKNISVADMAFSDNILYAVILNTSSNAKGSKAQVWSLAKGDKDFSQISLWDKYDKYIDPNQSAYLSLESLGSCLFLGFNNTSGDIEVWRAYYDDPDYLEQKHWEEVSIYNKSNNKKLKDTSNRLRWLYADQNNGYLYLGTEDLKDPNQRVTLWRSTKLPIITITSYRADASSQTDETYPYTYLGAFGPSDPNHKGKLNLKSTKTGNYTVSLIQVKDPNDSISKYPKFSDSSVNFRKVEVKDLSIESSTDLPTEQQGTYIGEIAWDANQNTILGTATNDKDRYPVLFSFVYDTDPPRAPVVDEVTPRSKKLDVHWNGVSDNFSGVVKYLIKHKEVAPEMDANDPNSAIFTNNDGDEQPVQKDNNDTYTYTIRDLRNGKRYAVAVFAVDAAGNSAQSKPTETSFGIPEPGRGLTDLVGETGGCFLETIRKGRIIFRRKE
jgi:hypothetical protein